MNDSILNQILQALQAENPEAVKEDISEVETIVKFLYKGEPHEAPYLSEAAEEAETAEDEVAESDEQQIAEEDAGIEGEEEKGKEEEKMDEDVIEKNEEKIEVPDEDSEEEAPVEEKKFTIGKIMKKTNEKSMETLHIGMSSITFL